ncbi:MAG TPA: xanthine dehydrogenase family protein molybdopterin-binding subunit [Beijerinckiaceae bacterium]|nr:xanthine dehydrogenase family protein molybdopterin-binding subunit [Beijerinckiaceae bacterium]
MSTDSMPDPSPRALGRAMPRAATRRLVAGRGRYVDDVTIKGELHAAFLRSPFAHASFEITDTAEAAATDGVVAVFTATDIERVCTGWKTVSRNFPGLVSPEQRPLAAGRAVFQGEPVAMVVAASRAIAEDALERIAVDWQEHAAVADLETALAPDGPKVHLELPSNLAWHTEIVTGDVDDVFARAALVVEEKFVFARKTGVTLEPRGVLASYDPSTKALLVHISHQMPHQLQLHLADFLGLSPVDVRVVCTDVGGAFGLKMHVYPDEIAACAASKLLGRPVKFIADRIEGLASDIHAREHIVDARMAVDGEGRILGFDVADRQGLGAYSVFPRSSTVEAMSGLRAVGAPYVFESYRARLDSVLQNKSMTGQYRSVGHPIGCTVTEGLVELAAEARGEDPVAFRRRNLLTDEAQPWTNPVGGRMFELSHHRCLDKMVALVDLPRLRAEIDVMRAEGRVVGLGIASFVEFTASNPEVYGKAGVPVAAADTVVLSLEPSGEVKAQASASELGQGIQQGLAQVVAEALGVDPEQVRMSTGDTATTPHGGGAWASRGAAITGEAAWGAGRKLREEVLGAAAALLQTTPERLDIVRGEIVDRDTRMARISLREIAETAALRAYEFPAGVQPQFSVTNYYRREKDAFIPTNGVQASLVEIDAGTGIVRPLKHWVVEDCGRVINPLLVDEQIRGGVVLGIGEALLEACRYDETGQFTSASLADYLVTMASEAPDVIIGHVETPYSGSVIGAKGAGEAGACASSSAVLNAVNDALRPFGGRVNELPISPVAVLRAMGKLGSQSAVA